MVVSLPLNQVLQYNASEPTSSLVLSKASNLFKLYLSDIGLLAAMYSDGIQLKILNREHDINFGSIYENAVAQELKAHGYTLYYYNSKKNGELDFLIEEGARVIPIEVKSGKSYNKHNALNRILTIERYDVSKAYVLSNENVSSDGKVVYLPIYMMMFIQKNDDLQDLIYKPDFSDLM